MTALIVIVWSIIGFIAGGMIATELGPMFGYRHMEGSSAYFGLFTGSPIGCLIAAVLSYKRSRSYGEDSRKRARFFLLTLGGVAVVIGGVSMYEGVRTSDYIDTKGQGAMWLTCYIRLPVGTPLPDKNVKVTFEMRSDKETRRSSPYDVPDWSLKDGRPEMQGNVEIYRASANRTMAVTIGSGPTSLFRLKAPARPKVYSYQGDWQKADGTEGGTDTGLEAKCAM